MGQVIWSPKAIQDLDRICAYIAQDSDTYARVFARQVTSLVAGLPDAPRQGWMVPEYEVESLRERLVHSYRIIYRITGDDVEIVTIVHGARQLPRNPP